MRIGYSALNCEDEYLRLKEEGQCEYVEVAKDYKEITTHFFKFLASNPNSDIVVTSVENMNISLSHYDQIDQTVRKYNCRLHFLEKELSDDNLYLKVLSGLAKRDIIMMSRRTHEGLKKAKEFGRTGGRPSVDQGIIQQIQTLYYDQKKTMREIAIRCSVSVGTVHKYKTEVDMSLLDKVTEGGRE